MAIVYYRCGWFYTAISRTTSSNGLRIIGEVPYSKIQRREDIEKEMARLCRLHERTKIRMYGVARVATAARDSVASADNKATDTPADF